MSKSFGAKGNGACLQTCSQDPAKCRNASLMGAWRLMKRFAAIELNDETGGAAQAAATCDTRIEALYRSTRPSLLQRLVRRTGLDVAEDLIQQVFLRLSHRENLDTIASLPGYLRVATDNALKDRYRQQARCEAQFHEPFDDTHPGHDPFAQLEARDRLVRIEQALGRLKPLTRDIFLARRLDGYSYAEIAEQTGLGVRGVEKQMSRALKQLARHLAED